LNHKCDTKEHLAELDLSIVLCWNCLAILQESSIAENRRLNGHLPNVDFRVGDVMDLDLEEGSCDIIFSNW
jgi:hypothetical protein